MTPVERLAPLSALAASRAVWRDRRLHFRTLVASTALRDASVIRGVDVWPLVQEQLAGVAWLQWPWSVRAMDEAAAALDAIAPACVVTYAEAGGWGRALILEARRRAIPSVGLQHGFIFRHWLNYLHEPDEIACGERGNPGFPHPTRTLLFDHYSAQHLRDNGRLPPGSLAVTGSPLRDALIDAVARSATERSVTRARISAAPDDLIVLLATKEREARGVLPGLIAAAARIRGCRLVIKPHPAETVGAYEPYVTAAGNVTVVTPDFPLAALLAICRTLVTVNSTVALDAAALGVPALVLGLPNNLTPLVDAGVLPGVAATDEIAPALRRILYDEGFRQAVTTNQKAVLETHSADRPGAAAARSAEAILALVADRRGTDS